MRKNHPFPSQVGSSPIAWKQRLLDNSAVLGVAVSPGADDVLRRLSELPRDADAIVSAAGIVPPEDDCLVPAPEDLPEDDCLWDASQERDWRERRFLSVEKEGNRDPSRGNSGTARS